MLSGSFFVVVNLFGEAFWAFSVLCAGKSGVIAGVGWSSVLEWYSSW
jgi:hypothetical protein